MGRPEPCVLFSQTFVHPQLDEYVDEVPLLTHFVPSLIGCFVATVCWKQTNGEDIGALNMIETIVNIATIMSYFILFFFQVIFAEPIVITACEFLEQNATSASSVVTLIG
ncbi:hypothetical protein C3L33_02442, partial [Rhododendron williamsianum]